MAEITGSRLTVAITLTTILFRSVSATFIITDQVQLFLDRVFHDTREGLSFNWCQGTKVKCTLGWVFPGTSTDGVADSSVCPLMFVLQPDGEFDIGQRLFTLYT